MSKTEDKILNIALAIINNDAGEVLIVKRKHPEKGSGGVKLVWAFPGGEVDNYSTHEEALAEAVLGETGHYIEAGKLINKRKHPQFPAKVHYYECGLTTTATTQFIEEDEIEQISWVSPKELRSYFETDFDKKVAKFLGA